MTDHDHTEYVRGCYRCELGRDEAADAEREEQADLLAAIEERRADSDFMARLTRLVDEERGLFDRLATPEARDSGRTRAEQAREFNTHENSLGAEHVRAIIPTLHDEESAELAEAFEIGDRAKIARELADVVYVAYTAAWAHNIDLDAALDEIHRAAMDKVRANVRREGDGKIIKPPGFVPPDMAAALADATPEARDRDTEARGELDADVQQGLRDIEDGALHSFEEAFGEPQVVRDRDTEKEEG